MSKISEFYSGKTVLISGATGFIGKVLLEKILSTFADVERIYLLLRVKRGLTPQLRLKKLLSNPIFTLNSITKSQMEKVYAINADLSKIGLGLSEKDTNRIINEVSIVLHVAASIHFHLNLEDSLTINTLSTKTLLELCTEMKHLESVVYVSTAFCNVDKDISEEKVYDFKNLDPNELLDSLKTKGKLNAIQNDLIQPHPNTYTFSKRMTEIIVRDFSEKLPLSIVRPAIVISAYKEPIPGWVDNLNGITGLLVAAGTGVVRLGYCNAKCFPELTPVDFVSNLIIASSWYRIWQKNKDASVFNLTQLPENKITYGKVVERAFAAVYKYPPKRMLWYPKLSLSSNFLHILLGAIFLHILPAIIIDGLLLVFRQKPFMVKVQKRIWLAQKLLSHFTTNNFEFDTKQMQKLYNELNDEDKKIFFGIQDFDLTADYFDKATSATYKYILKDDGESQFRYILLKILFILDKLIEILTIYGVIWLVLYIFGMDKLLTFNYWYGFF